MVPSSEPPAVPPSLPRSTPSAQGVDPGGISAFLDAVDAAPGVELHSLVVVRHGHVVAEGWWHPYTPGRVHLLYSLSKSVTSAAAGFAVAEGLLDLDATVLSYFPELDAHVTDPRSRAMRVRDVAAMASGHLAETADAAFAADDPVLGFLTIPPDRDPGTVFAYNQPCTYSLAAIVQRLTGGTLTDYLRPRLFDPLGIAPGGWQQHPAGREIGYSGLHLTTEDVARFGQCLLEDGRRQGRQVLPEGWVAEATRRHVGTAGSAGEAVVEARDGDWAQGYGQQFWRSRHGYRGDGAYGQFCVVVPESDLVVATTAAAPDMQAALDAVWAHVLPALADGPLPRSAADDALAVRLATLGLPPVPTGGPDAVPAGTVLRLAGTAALRGVTGAVLRRDATGWTLTLDAWDGTVVADVGTGGWAVTEPDDGAAPLAVSAGSPAPGQVRADVLLLETPHRLRLDGDVAAGTLTAAWATDPLGGVSLRSMASR
ncbi:serine hydrolase [Kineosporia sp. A_224]|uniref:serine hydrolase domain-containing protein n=1 Tax=Kineosporia sp. A_224 TaxID=1962180 RepID=UPI000B4B04D1|nr:serine hydrolase [Kineosporia sp. A_224]